ncbi:MAG TPA: trypsin-like serine protease [Planctomycetes bacterium]|nr:trypsin-like serine protease [Planctomycetaceae bacterium]HIM28555.1 trypsin-like serine protease [Planctomycetota bacterium]
MVALKYLVLALAWCAGMWVVPPAPSMAKERPPNPMVAEKPAATEDPPAKPAFASQVQRIVKMVRPALVSISSTDRDGKKHGVGTGFVIDSKGLIATNLHVIGENRRFEVELSGGRKLPVIAIHATDRVYDLAIVQVDPGKATLKVLELGDAANAVAGTPAVVMGNPLGLKDSVVSGIVSGNREIEGRRMIQLAIPIEPGNSGGPVVDSEGRVLGVVTMKSLVTENLGFAIEVNALKKLKAQPNPVDYKNWLTVDRMPPARWTTTGGADWRQRAGRIQVAGLGGGFAGRSLCLSMESPPDVPYEIAVHVQLDDERGAAGIAFHSDGKQRHYGFYPSGGRLRFTAFQGADVFSWRVLHDQPSEHYRPGESNELKVRVEKKRILCFVNGQLVFETTDRSLSGGSVGLAKFRQTAATFRRFKVAKEIKSPTLDEEQQAALLTLVDEIGDIPSMSEFDLQSLAEQPDANALAIARRVAALKKEMARLEDLSAEIRLQNTLGQLKELCEGDDIPLLNAALLLGKVDEPAVDVQGYMGYVRQTAEEIRRQFPKGDKTKPKGQFDVLRRILFRELGFHGSRHEYYHPANSHLHRVIDDREGLPISLGVVYMAVAEELGLKVEGIGLPGHFVVREVYSDDQGQMVDVFESGSLLSRKDAEEIVRRNVGASLTDSMLQPMSNLDILRRVTNNLIGAAERRQDPDALRRYLELAVTLDTESAQLRGMRALARFQIKRRAMALEDLQWFFDNRPDGVDLNRIEELRQFFLTR